MGTYRETLAAARKVSTVRASDEQLMALFCETSIQHVCGAVSPELVWDGAQKQGLTTLELCRLASANPSAVEELMWL